MILPTKRLSVEDSLLGVGTDALRVLTEPKPVSRVWDEIRTLRTGEKGRHNITFEWFVLALDFLYVAGAIELDHGLLRRTT